LNKAGTAGTGGGALWNTVTLCGAP
jgi:hypothetical protein